MLYYLVSWFFKNFMSLEIEIISMMLNQTSCETNCTFTGGHLPYLFEVKGFRTFNKGFSSKCRDMSISLISRTLLQLIWITSLTKWEMFWIKYSHKIIHLMSLVIQTWEFTIAGQECKNNLNSNICNYCFFLKNSIAPKRS